MAAVQVAAVPEVVDPVVALAGLYQVPDRDQEQALMQGQGRVRDLASLPDPDRVKDTVTVQASNPVLATQAQETITAMDLVMGQVTAGTAPKTVLATDLAISENLYADPIYIELSFPNPYQFSVIK